MKSVSGTSAVSKLSLSADSIDSDGVPFVDRQRTSRSILKKSDSGNNYYNRAGGDSDTEKLITDSTFAAVACDASSGTRARKRPVSPLLSRQVFESMFRTSNNADRARTTHSSVETEDGGKASVTRTPRILLSDVEGSYRRASLAIETKKNFRRFVVSTKESKGTRRPTLRLFLGGEDFDKT